MLMLRANPNLSGLDDESFVFLAENSSVRHYAEGELLQELGPPERVFMIYEGKILARRPSGTMSLEAPAGLGWLSVLASDTIGVEARAVGGSVKTLELPVARVIEVLEENWSLRRNGIRNLTKGMLARRKMLPAHPDRVPPGDEVPYPERSPTLVERIIAARKQPLFAQCNVEAVATICRAQTTVRLEAGEVLWRKGETPTHGIRLDYGQLHCDTGEDSCVVAAPFTLGIFDGFASEPRPYTLTTHTRIVGTRLDFETFATVLEEYPDLSTQLMAFLARDALDQGYT